MFPVSTFGYLKCFIGIALFIGSFFWGNRANRWILFCIHALANAFLFGSRATETRGYSPFQKRPGTQQDDSQFGKLRLQSHAHRSASVVASYGVLVGLCVGSAADPGISRGAPLLLVVTGLWELFSED